METSESKKQAIRQGIQETRQKRKAQVCQVFELKIDESRLNKVEKEQLKMYFVEAKWLYNHILRIGKESDIFKFDYKQKDIEVMNKDGELEPRTLKFLPAKNRQDVRNGLYNSIKGLAASKKKGRKVGKLKFKAFYNSVWFSQNEVSHSIKGKNRFRLAGIKRPLLVRGLKQITKKHEVADAKLLKKPNGYYIKLTTYSFPEGGIQNNAKIDVGLDFGIKTSITTSEGEKIHVSIAEPDRLKRLQHKQARGVKGSNNRYKMNNLIAIEYQKLDNQKRDAANKILHHLRSDYKLIFMQDENLKGWHSGRYGKQVQHSILGLVKAKLLQCKQTVVIDRWMPTTKCCYICGNIRNVGLDERMYVCECGLNEDRDVKAAKTALKMGQMSIGIKQKRNIQIPTEYRDFKPVETKTNAKTSVKSKSFSMKQEARDFSHG